MSIGPRLISALLLATLMAMLFWLAPNLEPAMVGATSPDSLVLFFTVLFVMFWTYLVVQGYPVSHGNIGSSSTHNLDNMVSGLPAITALFGVFLHFVGFWKLSNVNIMLATMTLAVVMYDLWILGGAASKINRLTDEFKSVR